MVDRNDPLFKELQDEVRREQWAKLWEKYGTYLLLGAALVVAVVAGFKFWEGRQLALAQASGARYEAAQSLLSAGKPDEAQAALKEIGASGPRGYGALAELSLAGAHLKAGRRPEALAALDSLASSSRGDAMLRSFAALQAASLRLGEADFTEMQNRLNPLMGDDAPWRYNARELLGVAAAKAGQTETARTTLGPLLIDTAVPRSIVDRVRVTLEALTAKERSAAASAAPTPAAAPTADPAPAAPPAEKK